MGADTRQTYIYARVSTKKQSHARQDKGLAAYLQNAPEGAQKVTETFSGRECLQPKLQAIQKEIAAGKVKELAVYDLDRLGRNASELLRIRDLCKSQGTRLWVEKLGMDLTTDLALVVMSVLAALAQLESEKISERVVDGMAAGKEAGYKYGGALFAGLRWISKKNKPKVKQIKDLAAAGNTVNSICLTMHMTSYQVKWVIETPACDILTREQLSRRLQLPSQRRPRKG